MEFITIPAKIANMSIQVTVGPMEVRLTSMEESDMVYFRRISRYRKTSLGFRGLPWCLPWE